MAIPQYRGWRAFDAGHNARQGERMRRTGTRVDWERREAALAQRKAWEPVLITIRLSAWQARLVYRHCRATGRAINGLFTEAVLTQLMRSGWDVEAEAERVRREREEWTARERERLQGGR